MKTCSGFREEKGNVKPALGEQVCPHKHRFPSSQGGAAINPPPEGPRHTALRQGAASPRGIKGTLALRLLSATRWPRQVLPLRQEGLRPHTAWHRLAPPGTARRGRLNPPGFPEALRLVGTSHTSPSDDGNTPSHGEG